jgi:hypothetical protein
VRNRDTEKGGKLCKLSFINNTKTIYTLAADGRTSSALEGGNSGRGHVSCVIPGWGEGGNFGLFSPSFFSEAWPVPPTRKRYTYPGGLGSVVIYNTTPGPT